MSAKVKARACARSRTKSATSNLLAQCELDLRRRTHGGARPGAGRKRLARKHDPDHRTRPPLVPRHPIHVVLRTLPDVGRLRRGKVFAAARKAMRDAAARTAAARPTGESTLLVPAPARSRGDETRAAATDRSSFQVVHISIQHNHIHMLVEATSNTALSAGMQRLTITLARAINRSLGRKGKVFAYRYHRTDITSPRQARNALAYVLNNWRRHRENETTVGAQNAILDPYSTAVVFTGWHVRFAVPTNYEPLPVSPPSTWLLSVGWKRHGELDPLEPPGPLFVQTRRKMRQVAEGAPR